MGETPREAELLQQIAELEREIMALEDENARLRERAGSTYNEGVKKRQKAIADEFIAYLQRGLESGRIGLKRLNAHDCPDGRQIGLYEGDKVYLGASASVDCYNNVAGHIKLSRPNMVNILKTCSMLDRTAPTIKKYMQGTATQCVVLSPRYSKILLDAHQRRQAEKTIH